jgi:hypothetical protein
LTNSTNIINEKLKELQLPSINTKEDKITNIHSKKELHNKLIDALDNK